MSALEWREYLKFMYAYMGDDMWWLIYPDESKVQVEAESESEIKAMIDEFTQFNN